MIFTLKNTTRRPMVIQLEHRVSGGAFKSRSETVVRVDHDAKGNAQPVGPAQPVIAARRHPGGEEDDDGGGHHTNKSAHRVFSAQADQ